MKTSIGLAFTVVLFAAGAIDAQESSKCVEPACSTTVARVLYPASVPIVIRKTGLYVLDRSWTIYEQKSAPLIEIRGNGVVLDLRGFTITYQVSDAQVLLEVNGNYATVKNGQLSAGNGEMYAPTLVGGSGSSTTVENMKLYTATGGVILQDGSAVIRDTEIGARTEAVLLAPGSTVERSSIGCDFRCMIIHGTSRIIDSNISGTEPLRIDGDGNLMWSTQVAGAVDINGSWNVLRNNIIRGGINVNGTGNVLDANIVPRNPEGEIASDGIRFTVDGNFYGNNRVAAPVPFDVGATVQTDWGGNVAF